MPINLPILLTWLRIFAIPLLLLLYYLPESYLSLLDKNMLATLLFVFVALTDWADGFIARRFNMVSQFGEFLDPVADKLMVSAALIMLVYLGRCHAVLAVIIIGREIAVSALREWMSRLGSVSSVAVSTIGKVKTAVQLTAIPMLLFDMSLFGLPIPLIGNILIWIAGVLTLISMFCYLMRAREVIRQNGYSNF